MRGFSFDELVFRTMPHRTANTTFAAELLCARPRETLLSISDQLTQRGIRIELVSRSSTTPAFGKNMIRETYKGYVLWGHAIAQQAEILTLERYAGSGTVTRDNKLINASGVLELFSSEDDAQEAGLAWARAWVDTNG